VISRAAWKTAGCAATRTREDQVRETRSRRPRIRSGFTTGRLGLNTHLAHHERLSLAGLGIIGSMLTRYIHEAMKRARYRTLKNGTSFGQIPGLTGVWANEGTMEERRKVLQEVLEEWLILKIRDRDPIPRLGRITLPLRAA